MSNIMTNTHGIYIPPRYVIRRLDHTVLEWVVAMGIEGFMLRDDSIWKPLLPHPKTANALRGLDKLAGYYQHALTSGFSFGIFDTQYVFSHPQSAATGRMLHWRGGLDPGQLEFETYGADQMRVAMDFPLVCMALSCDAFAPVDPRVMQNVNELMPLQAQLNAFLSSASDDFGKGKGKATRGSVTDYGQILSRFGCVTRLGYENRGLATALNRFVMLEAKAWGFRGIRVGTGNASVLRFWMDPPKGFQSEIVAHWNFEDIEMQDEEGRVVKPYRESGMRDGWEVYCNLSG
ncbi:hypothetical protein GGR57DRAFT_482558 [Xylariaceae sp. FL1272]|nr:hypothetical protein GGR57DRAFT_482558 [Xylariaceae sp. FL1272]